jgi:membrane protein YqaA with SNARE-associated domain
MAAIMRWQFWLKRGKQASSAAKYAAEVLYASWIPPLPQTVIVQAAPMRARNEPVDIGAFLRRVYSNQEC